LPPLKIGYLRADTMRVGQEELVAELRQALLEIEWTSRRAQSTPLLERICDLARSALVTSSGERSGDNISELRRPRPLVDAVAEVSSADPRRA
jgi:hypothetical protein